jgi:malate dehydrogenase (quinone)
MVLAVGDAEVVQLRTRFEEIRSLYPELRLLEREEIAQWEPSVLEGRPADEPLLALATEHGFSINFGALAQSFARQATETRTDFQIQTNKRVISLVRGPNGFILHMQDDSNLFARTVVVAAGAHSLSLAHKLGYGRDLSIIPVAGFFYTATNRLRGKVYTVQHPKLPFAAIHGDPDILDTQTMRFGPIAKALPLLERGKWSTVWDFFRVFPLTADAIKSVWKINTDRIVRTYIWKNFWYDIPWTGPRLFIREVKKIIPNMQPRDIVFGHNLAGIRPQVVHLREYRILLGEAKIVESDLIFNITPSPGASVCLANALADTKNLSSGSDLPCNSTRLRHSATWAPSFLLPLPEVSQVSSMYRRLCSDNRPNRRLFLRHRRMFLY